MVYFHGAIGTPVDATVDLQRITRRVGARYIAPSRPGIGGSDPQPGRTIMDFASDVDELADRLLLDRFSVIGVSAGAPYALAAAHQLGLRVQRVALCSALAPFAPPHLTPGLPRRIRLPLALLAAAPWLARLAGDALPPLLARHPDLIMRVISAHAAPAERDRLARSEERVAATRSFLDATRGGVGGLIDDYLTYSRGWGFDPCDVGCEVQLWHGSADPLVPVEHALQLAAVLRDCRVMIDPDEGHHFFRSGLERILESLLDGAVTVSRARAVTVA